MSWIEVTLRMANWFAWLGAMFFVGRAWGDWERKKLKQENAALRAQLKLPSVK